MNRTNMLLPYLRGIGQIMLQNNALTGLLFLLGILINSPLMALAIVIATITGTLTAKLLKYNEEDINTGLYGFNAALVGAAFIAFFQPCIATWVSLVALAAASTVIMHFFLWKKLPAFTFPFILLVWIALFVFHNIIPIDAPPITVAETDPNSILFNAEAVFALTGYGFGFGEVIFQGSMLSGIIFFIAIYINSPISALYGLLGSVLGVAMAFILREQDENIKLFSFNTVLCAIAFAGPKKESILYVALAGLPSGLVEDRMIEYNLSILTFPFVFGSWATILIRDKVVGKIFPSTIQP